MVRIGVKNYHNVSLVPRIFSKINAPGEQNWCDSLRLKLIAGNGGHGMSAMNGFGGKGGDIIFYSQRSAISLIEAFAKYKHGVITAPPGLSSEPKRLIAPPAKNVLLRVPLGIDVFDESRQLIATFDKPGERAVIAKGGKGGNFENNYIGQEGEITNIYVDLKLIADIGFVGFPNAGKSTLLRAISRANPKVAAYAFTTLKPNIGIIEYENSSSTVSCTDLPGLIEGAHINVGLGHHFLRHVERTKFLMFVIDASGFQYSPNHAYRTALEALLLLNKELELYDPLLVEKPSVIVLTKLDARGAKLSYRNFLLGLKELILSDMASQDDDLRPHKMALFQDIIPVSSATGLNIPYLREQLRKLVMASRNNYLFTMQRNNSMLSIIDRKLTNIVTAS